MGLAVTALATPPRTPEAVVKMEVCEC